MARSLHFEAKLLNLDEPTTAFSVKGVERVLQYVEELKNKGIAVIFVSHNLRHAYPVADRFVIMKGGKIIHEAKKENTSIEELSKLIVSG